MGAAEALRWLRVRSRWHAFLAVDQDSLRAYPSVPSMCEEFSPPAALVADGYRSPRGSGYRSQLCMICADWARVLGWEDAP